MVRALLIEVKSWYTGERAFGVNPRDPNLRALGGPLWQVLDHEPKGDWEVRLVLDDRDLSGYTGRIILDDGSEVYSVADIPADATIVDVDGVIVLNSKEEINRVLDHIPDKIYVSGVDRERLIAWAVARGVTPRSVEDEIRARVKEAAMKGHYMVSQKRGRPVEHVVFGQPPYAFLKKLHDMGCPLTWKAVIPRV